MTILVPQSVLTDDGGNGTPPLVRWMNEVTKGVNGIPFSTLFINVRDYGATGDGTTDDTAAIQAAMSAAHSVGGGTVYFPVGTYGIKYSVTIWSNTTVMGSGKGSVLKALAGFTGTAAGNNSFLLTNANRTAGTITDDSLNVIRMAFDYGSVVIAGGGAHAINFRMAKGIKVVDCYFNAGENATAMVACKDTLVDGCTAYGFINCAYDHWEAPQNARVVNCFAQTASSAQMVNFNPEDSAGAGTGTADGFLLANCQLIYTGASSLPCVFEPLHAGTVVKNVSVVNNTFSNVFVAMRGDVRDSAMIGNTFTNMLGTVWSFAASPQYAATPSNIRFIGNTIVNPLTDAGNIAVIVMWANGYQVTGNTVTGTNHFAALSTTGYVGDVLANSFTVGTSGYSIIGTSQFPAWVAPTLLNAWVNFGGTFANAAYWKDQYGVVHLRGSVRAGAIGSDIFVLPATGNYRPSADLVFAVPSNSAFGSVTVKANGSVTPLIGSNAIFSLDGITFRVD